MSQAGVLVVAHIAKTCIFPPAPVRDFRRWCHTIGPVLQPHFPRVTQQGTLRKPWQPRCFLACILRAFSDARTVTVDRLAFENVGSLPVWHFAIFQNKHHRAFVAPRLVRKRVLVAHQLLDDQLQVLPACTKLMGSTWVPVCATAL